MCHYRALGVAAQEAHNGVAVGLDIGPRIGYVPDGGGDGCSTIPGHPVINMQAAALPEELSEKVRALVDQHCRAPGTGC